MDSNSVPVQNVSQPQVNPLPQEPNVAVNQHSNKKIISSLIILLFIVLLAAGGYMYYLGTKVSSTPVQKVVTKVLITPTPGAYQINPNDTSNKSITQDNQALNNSLNSVSQDLNSVDQSFSDQQTNLQ